MTNGLTAGAAFHKLLQAIETTEQPGCFLIPTAIALLAIVIWGKRKGRVLFLYPPILIAALLFNPYSLALLGRERGTALWSFFALLPLSLILVYGAVCIGSRFQKRRFRLLVAVLFALTLALTGVPAVSGLGELKAKAENFDSQSQAEGIADLILKDASSDRTTVFVEEEDLARQIRFCNPAISCKVQEGTDEEMLKKELGEEGIDYYIVKRESGLIKILEQDADQIGYSADYMIYRR